jgi:gluconolactonase
MPAIDSSLSRREFLKTAALSSGGAAVALFGGSAAARVLAAEPPAERYRNLQTEKYLGEVQTETRIEDAKVFTEGPAVDRAGNVFFTNVPVEKILRWDPRAKKLTVFRENSGLANGLLFDPDGNLLACEGAGRVTRTDMKTGKVTVLVDDYKGHSLGAPNDLALDAAGRVYFTSRLENTDPEKGNVNSVYRVDSDGKVERILHAPHIDMPNGIVTSPDDKTLYLVESDGRAERSRCIRAYDLHPDGTVANGRILINFYPGRSGDGMAIDAEGNLYIAAGLHKPRATSETLDTRPGIHVVSPAGKLLAFRETPEDTITNCTFGGEDLKTLYVTCGTYLLSIRTPIPGKPAYRPKTD